MVIFYFNFGCELLVSLSPQLQGVGVFFWCRRSSSNSDKFRLEEMNRDGKRTYWKVFELCKSGNVFFILFRCITLWKLQNKQLKAGSLGVCRLGT